MFKPGISKADNDYTGHWILDEWPKDTTAALVKFCKLFYPKRLKSPFVFCAIRAIVRAYWNTLFTSLHGRSSGERRSLVV